MCLTLMANPFPGCSTNTARLSYSSQHTDKHATRTAPSASAGRSSLATKTSNLPTRKWINWSVTCDSTEVTDVLFTGGDPMVMKAKVLERYIRPILEDPELEHIRTIRIGTKSVAYWPQRYVSDADADDVLRLFEDVVKSGRTLGIMGHYSWSGVKTDVSREAIRRIRSTGANIAQSPVIRHVNDNAGIWKDMWREGRPRTHSVLHVCGTRHRT